MIYIVKINDKEYEVEVERGKANIIKTTTAPKPAAPPPAAEPAPVPASQTTNVPAEGELVKSPMPGTIIEIKVNSGTQVKRGEVLLILEAMKMENEVVAPSDGVVTQVFTAKGASVNTGDALISIR